MTNMAVRQVSTQAKQSFWRRLFIRLTKPADTLSEIDKERATSLAMLTLIFLIMGSVTEFLFAILAWVNGGALSLPGSRAFFIILFMLLGYVLSRTRFFVLGAYMQTLTPVLSIFILVMISESAVSQILVSYVVLSIIMSGLLLNTMGTLLVGALCFSFVMAIYAFLPTVDTLPTPPIVFILFATILTFIANWFRENNLKRLYKTQTELHKSQKELIQFNETLETRVTQRTGEIRELERRTRAIIQNLPGVAIVLIDLNYRMVLADGPELETIGYSKAFEGKVLSDWLSVERLSILKLMMERIKQGEVIQVEEPFGGQFFSVVYAPIFDDDGNAKHMLSMSIDITERKLAEQACETLIDNLKTARRIAEENSRLKSEFLSTMSHELRTPLNAIEGFTSIMLGKMGIELNPRAADMVQRIGSNSKRLLHLIDDFLDLSRIESGRVEMTKAPISPQQLVENWKNEMGILGEERNLDFNATIHPDLPPMLLGDEDALTKIATNLLGNAFKFTHEGHVSLNLYCKDNTWSIAVSDTGIGIPPHAHEYIFDEFRQLDGSSKRLYGGTGLGLSLVQRLSHVMGGNVSLESEVGQGSTFTVTLPLELPDETQRGDETKQGVKE